MKTRLLPGIAFWLACSALLSPVLVAQSNVQLFSAVDVRLSQSTANYVTPDFFNTTTLNLTCSASPISAVISGPLMNGAGTAPQLSASGALQPGGNLLVDNNIVVTVTPNGGTANAPANVCPQLDNASGTPALYTPNCFVTGYQSPAAAGAINGVDTDTGLAPGSSQTIDAAGGVAPVDISALLVPGAQSATISLADEGGWLANSTLFLTTNCTPGGVTGPALVTGNTIGSNPTPDQLTQTFTFNPVTSQAVGFVYDLSGAQNSLISNSGQSTPQVGDLPINPATFQSNLAPNTPFATSECLVHSGELGGPSGEPATQPACKLYTLECTTGTNPAASGAQCPISSMPNEGMEDIFDGPDFKLHDIHTPDGHVFHEGIGFLMASEGWGAESGVPPGTWDWNAGPGGPCTFDPAANLNLPCPQNLLTSFAGPGLFTSSGQTTHPNSTFITIAQVPEPHTHVRIEEEEEEAARHWVNSNTVNVHFDIQPPDLRGASLPGAAAFIPAPIQSITYGISPANTVPNPANEPISGDVTVMNSTCPIPTAADPGPPVEPDFVPAVQTLAFPADGHYVLHYYAQDCAGTQDLDFKKEAGTWTTNFRTREINVDTVPPTITPTALVLTGNLTNGKYAVGEKVTVSYACTDATSGVVLCGDKFFWHGTSDTGTLTSRVGTSRPGTHTFTVWAVDAAGNSSTQSVSYQVTGKARD